MVGIKNEQVSIYFEYLDNICLVNLIITTGSNLLGDYLLDDELLSLTFENEKILKIKFIEFKSMKNSAKMTRKNVLTKEGCFESIIRFQVIKNSDSITNQDNETKAIKEINKLTCLSCQQNILNTQSLTKYAE